METKVKNIVEATKPEWFAIMSAFLMKDGYRIEISNQHYVTFRKGYFWDGLHQVTINKQSVSYSREIWREGDKVSQLSEPLTVTTEIDAAIIISMLQFAGAFSQPIFKAMGIDVSNVLPFPSSEESFTAFAL